MSTDPRIAARAAELRAQFPHAFDRAEQESASVTQAQLINLGKYAGAALLGAVIATGLLLGQVLSGTGAVEWRPLAAVFVSTFFGSLATAVGSSLLPRYGSEGLAKQVGALRALGYSRKDLTVVTSDEATRALGRPVR